MAHLHLHFCPENLVLPNLKISTIKCKKKDNQKTLCQKTKRSVIEAEHKCDVPIVGAFQPLRIIIFFFLKERADKVFYIFKENTNQEKPCPNNIKQKIT